MDNIPSNYNDIITFVTNNIAYAKIKGSKNNFFEFSESTGKWIKRADCPLEYTSYSISLNKRGYLGYIYSGKLYEYKPENDVWVKKLSYPGCNSCTYYFGFAINNVGYIGNISSCNGDCNSSFYSFLP